MQQSVHYAVQGDQPQPYPRAAELRVYNLIGVLHPQLALRLMIWNYKTLYSVARYRAYAKHNHAMLVMV